MYGELKLLYADYTCAFDRAESARLRYQAKEEELKQVQLERDLLVKQLEGINSIGVQIQKSAHGVQQQTLLNM